MPPDQLNQTRNDPAGTPSVVDHLNMDATIVTEASGRDRRRRAVGGNSERETDRVKRLRILIEKTEPVVERDHAPLTVRRWPVTHSEPLNRERARI